MKVEKLITIAKATCLKNIQTDDNTVMFFINQALEELNRRFAFNTKAVVIHIVPEKFTYTVENPDLNLVLALYNSNGKLLVTSDVIDSIECDYKLISYNSFIMVNPKEDYVTCVYKASMKEMTDLQEEIPIPTIFINALLDYLAYLGHSTLMKNLQETNFRLAKFNDTCNALIGEGYRVELATESYAVDDKGFV